mgnify:CR=1 FL=1
MLNDDMVANLYAFAINSQRSKSVIERFVRLISESGVGGGWQAGCENEAIE